MHALLLMLAALLAPGDPPAIVVTDVPASDPFHVVVEAACRAGGVQQPLRFEQPRDLLEALRKQQPDHVLVVVRPGTLDVNFAYDFLDVAARVDDDPFTDFAYGFITGRDPKAALAFLAATQRVRRKPSLVKRSLLDIMGPNMLDNDKVIFWGRAATMPELKGFTLESLNHGRKGFDAAALGKLRGYGYVHIGGHGVPERIVQGLTAEQMAQVDFANAIVFNGACWTGVTGPWFDWRTGVVRKHETKQSFCLSVLERGAAAHLAALHPDHGIPVYQEMERMFSTGEPLGLVIKHTYDQLVLAAGGKRPELPRWKDGAAPPRLGRGTMERYGTAARVLFGDPRTRPTEAVVRSPYHVKVKSSGAGLQVTAAMRTPELKYTHMDTFAGDLAKNPMQFNDRFYFRAELPANAKVTQLEVVEAEAKRKPIRHRLVGWAIEDFRGKRYLHVQIDFPSHGYQRSDIRNPSARVTLRVR